MLVLGQGAETRLDVLPATLIFKRSAHGLLDERTATPPAGPSIELRDEVILERYV
jgi:hypothetical protein